MKTKKSFIKLLNISVVCLSVISTVMCLNKRPAGYDLLFCLPVAYCICYLICFMVYQKRSILCMLISICAFLRYVLLPFVYSVEPVYGFSQYSCHDTDILNKAIFLMSYELFIVSLFVIVYNFFHKTKNIKDIFYNNKNELGITRKYKFLGISIFLIVAAMLIVRTPTVLNQINFLWLKSDTGNRVGAIAATAGTFEMLIRQVLIIAILSFFVIIVSKIKETRKNKNSGLIISLIFAGVCTCIIISEQRSSQIYCAFASIILLSRLYPDRKKLIITSIVGVCIFVVALLTIYKTFFAFKYDSYIEALETEGLNLKTLAQTLEVYLLGPQTVASSIEFAEKGSFTFSQFMYDIQRSFIGLSFFVKGGERYITSESYNLFITNGSATSGYLLPLTGNAYGFVGFIFSPFLICFVYWIAFKLEKIMLSSKVEYIVFFSAYVYIRLATCMIFSNWATILNLISSILISAGIVYMFQIVIETLLRRKKIICFRESRSS